MIDWLIIVIFFKWQVQAIFRGGGRRSDHCAGPEVTGSGPDRKWRHGSMFCACTDFPYVFILTIVVVQHVPWPTWLPDVTWPVNVTRSDVIKPEVGFQPFFWCFLIFSRFFAMLCSTPRVLSITSVFSLWYLYQIT